MIPPELAELAKMMQLPEGMPSIWSDLAGFQKFMSDFHAQLTDPVEREAMGKALADLDKATAKAHELVPGLLQEMKASAEQLQTEAQGLAGDLERAKQEFAEKKAEAAKAQEMASTPPPPPSVQPDLSKTMAAELLQMFGAVQPDSGEDLQGSVASAWVDPAASGEGKPAPAKAKDTFVSKGKKPPKKKDDIWEGLSHMDDS